MHDVICSNCGITFSVYPKRYFNRTNFFCSKKCEGEFRKRKNPNYISCDVCGINCP